MCVCVCERARTLVRSQIADVVTLVKLHKQHTERQAQRSLYSLSSRAAFFPAGIILMPPKKHGAAEVGAEIQNKHKLIPLPRRITSGRVTVQAENFFHLPPTEANSAQSDF